MCVCVCVCVCVGLFRIRRTFPSDLNTAPSGLSVNIAASYPTHTEIGAIFNKMITSP
jgi:hypothetical protein